MFNESNKAFCGFNAGYSITNDLSQVTCRSCRKNFKLYEQRQLRRQQAKMKGSEENV